MFAQVVLPLSMPGVAAGTLLVFVLSLGFYITPALVGGPRDLMLSMLIAQQVDLLNWPYAACLSAALLAVTLLLIAGVPAPAGRAGRAADGDTMIGRIAFRVLWILVLVFLALPILIVVVLSFSSASYLTFPPPAFGIRWYRAYLGSSEWLASTWLSLGVAGCVVVLSTMLGTLASLGLARLPPACEPSWAR